MKSGVAAVLIVLGVVGCTQRQGSDIRSGTITVLVTESHLPLVQHMAAEYHDAFPNAVIEPKGTTTRAAIVEMANDSVQCIVVDRRLNEEERAAMESARLRVVETEIAQDGIAVLVHRANKLSSVTMDELAAILTGNTGVWNALPASTLRGPIALCLTGKNSGLYEMVVRHFFKIQGDVPVAAVAASQRAILEYVATHTESMGLISYGLWRDTSDAAQERWKKNVQLLAFSAKDSQGVVSSVKLNPRNVYDRYYPLTYSLFIYTSEKLPGAAQGFSAFVAGERGQRMFQYAGLVPKTIPYRTIQLTQE
jgi:phosphate transport system substrate-binding protein